MIGLIVALSCNLAFLKAILGFFLGAIFRSLEYEGDLLIVLYIFGTVFALWSFVIGEETAKKN